MGRSWKYPTFKFSFCYSTIETYLYILLNKTGEKAEQPCKRQAFYLKGLIILLKLHAVQLFYCLV